jgi:hypothetical protein
MHLPFCNNISVPDKADRSIYGAIHLPVSSGRAGYRSPSGFIKKFHIKKTDYLYNEAPRHHVTL